MFDRDYLLTVNYPSQTVTVTPPMRIAFDCTKAIDKGLSKCNVTIFNLKESTRLKLIRDDDEKTPIQLTLQVGYKGQRKTVFSGQVHRGESAREGVNFVTKLEALDGGFDLYNTVISKTVKGKDNVLKHLTETSQTKLGTVTKQSSLTRPRVLVGNMVSLLNQVVEDKQDWYIENGKLNIVGHSEAVSGYIPVIAPESGLISTPTREKTIITFMGLINPSVEIGKLVSLQSTTAKHLNGTHKVQAITYKGDIDGADWAMSVECKAGDYARIK
jgi:hypothetical protein